MEVNELAKTKTAWTESGLVTKRTAGAAPVERGRKGGYLSDRNLDLNRSQSIEDLTGNRIKKKS